MLYNVVSLSAATSTENLQALEEVKDFCTTDLGQGGSQRWTYHILSESAINRELWRLCDPQSSTSVDSVTFQPCTEYVTLNQDRYSIEQWPLPGGTWQFNAVYDGHCGHDTVNFVWKRLPPMIRMSLQTLLSGTRGTIPSPEQVSGILTGAIRHLDDAIRSDLLNFLPMDRLRHLSPDQLRNHIQRHEAEWEIISSRCTQGATVILSLLDPSKKHIWIVNLGDSQAVFAKKTSGKWSGSTVNALHNGNNPLERQRILREHPGEYACVADNRVIGYLAPTRAIGDTWLKLPSVYTRRALGAHMSDWMAPVMVEQYAARIVTPPYVSSAPDAHHCVLGGGEAFLILCSDGLLDLYDHIDPTLSESDLAQRWTDIVGHALGERRERGAPRNLAFDLLRDAIGGKDLHLASRNLTLEMDDKWIDDVTVLVQRF